jgi:hypothetical protein
MGFFEKRKFRNFLIFLQSYDKEKPSTWLKGGSGWRKEKHMYAL